MAVLVRETTDVIGSGPSLPHGKPPMLKKIHNNILHSMYPLTLFYLWHPFTSVVRDQMTSLHHMQTADVTAMVVMTSARGWTRPDTSVHLGGPATNDDSMYNDVGMTSSPWQHAWWRHHFGDCTTHVGDCAITHVDDAILTVMTSDDSVLLCCDMCHDANTNDYVE